MKRYLLGGFFSVIALIAGCVVLAPQITAQAQVPAPFQTGTFTGPTSSPVVLTMTGGQNSVWYHQTGTPGPVDAYVSNDNSHWTPTGIYAVSATAALTLATQPVTGSSGVDYLIWPVGLQFVKIAPDASWSGQSSSVLLRGSAAIALVPGNGGGGSAGPCPTAGSNISISGTSMPGCLIAATTPTPLPSPTAINTTGASSSCVWSGLVETCTFQTPGGSSATCSPTATPPAYECTTAYNGAATTPSPVQSGFIAAQAAFLGPRPSPSATANFLGYAAGTDSSGTYGCSGGSPAGYMAIGTSAHETTAQVNGVNGGALTLWCFNTADHPPYMAISLGGGDSYPGGRCCVASLENYYNQGYDVDYPAGFAGIDGIYWESNNPYGCGFTQHQSSASYTTYYDAYPATPSPDACTLNLNSLTLPSVGASSTVCTNASSVVSPCPSPPGGAVTSVTATSTPCGSAPLASPTAGAVVVYVPWQSAGCGGGSTPTPNPYVSTVLAETSATHFWEMDDSPGGATPGPCPSTAADAISGGATAVPSPVSLTVIASPLPHPAGSPLALQCGLPGPIKNGNTAMEWLGIGSTPAKLTIPSPVFQTLCNASGGSCNLPFTVECIVVPGNASAIGSQLTQGYAYIWSIDTSASHGAMYDEEAGSGDLAMILAAPGTQQFGLPASGMAVMLDYEFDGTSESYYYINGTLAGYAAETPSKNASDLSFFGWDGTSANRYWNGRMQGCSTYNTMLSLQQIRVHFAATGLP